jgi:ferrous iron transport protein B
LGGTGVNSREPGAASAPGFVALVGSPNSGKTTLFNWLTGARFKTVNYPGATVDYSLGRTQARYGERLVVMDTPGTYSLQPKSPDERVAFDAIFRHPELGAAAAVISVVDATQASRHLLVTQQLLAAGFPVVVALTMVDLVRERGDEVDALALSKRLGCPVVEIDGRLGGGVPQIVAQAVGLVALSAATEGHAPASPGRIAGWSARDTESAMAVAAAAARELCAVGNAGSRPGAGRPPGARQRGSEGPDARKRGSWWSDARLRTKALDRVLLHPLFGLIAFFAIMGSLFSGIFWLATPFMQGIDWAFSSLGEQVQALAPASLATSFLANGVIASASAVLTFVPQIFILFLGISLLEDSGYLARSAALVDRPFSFIGMNGRSFVPLLSGYACAVPAMMAARTINSRRERLITLFVIPLMSCSARLPVYALLLSFLYRGSSSWKGGLALAALYFISLAVGAVAATVASRFIPAREPSFFMLELPLYRRPSFRHAARSAFARTKNYVRKAGPAIFVFALLIWSATTFPRYQASDATERLQSSYAGQLGQAMQPVFQPMGADWRVGVGLISAFAAREVFVSSLAMVFHVADGKSLSMRETLLAQMSDARAPDGRPLFTLASILGLIAFFMIALQCLSTVAIAVREMGGWRLAAAQLLLFNLAGYAVAVTIVQGLRALGVN